MEFGSSGAQNMEIIKKRLLRSEVKCWRKQNEYLIGIIEWFELFMEKMKSLSNFTDDLKIYLQSLKYFTFEKTELIMIF